MERILVAGFGNPYRQDDGAGPAVVNALLQRLGRPALEINDDGFDELGNPVDVVVLHQLVPELSETLIDYDRVIFVDSHVGTIPEDIRVQEIEATFKTPFVPHQTHPASILALTRELSGRTPHGILLSVRGREFEFGLGLSERTRALVPAAVDRIMEYLPAGVDVK
jgi:hydrogenase maturation protease